MNPPSQPLSAVKVVLRSFGLNIRMFPTFLALGIICFVIPFVVSVMSLTALARDMPVLGVIGLIVTFVLYLGAYVYFFAATTLAVWLHLTHVKARSFQIVRRLRGRVAWGAIAVGFRVSFKVMLGFLLLLIPGLIWYTKYIMSVPAVVVEQVYGEDAMDRSVYLAEGHRWRVFGALVFFLVVYETIVLGANYGLTPLLLSLGVAQDTTRIVQILGSLLAMAVIPTSAIFPVLMYFDLRNRKEAITLPVIRDIDTLGAVV